MNDREKDVIFNSISASTDPKVQVEAFFRTLVDALEAKGFKVTVYRHRNHFRIAARDPNNNLLEWTLEPTYQKA